MPYSMIYPSKSYEKKRRPAFIFNASLDKWSALILCSLQTWIKSYKQIEYVGSIAYMSDIRRNALLSPTSIDEFTFSELISLHRPDHTTSRFYASRFQVLCMFLCFLILVFTRISNAPNNSMHTSHMLLSGLYLFLSSSMIVFSH